MKDNVFHIDAAIHGQKPDGTVVVTSPDITIITLIDGKRYPIFKETLNALISLNYIEVHRVEEDDSEIAN